MTDSVVKAKVIDVYVDGPRMTVEFRFTALQQITEFVSTNPLPSRPHVLSFKGGADSASVDLVGRQILFVIELIEGARLVANEAARMTNSPDYSAVGQITKFSRQSPIEIVMESSQVAIQLIAVVASILGARFLVSQIRSKELEGSEHEALTERAHGRTAR